MQYISKNPLIEELKSIASYNKTEKAINTKSAINNGNSTEVINKLFTDKEYIKLFLSDIQDIINDSNYNTKKAVLSDLKDILISLKILSTRDENTKTENVVNTLDKTVNSLNKIFKEKNIKINNIQSVITRIINQPLDKKYIAEIFKTLNTTTLVNKNSKTPSLITIINNLSDYNNYVNQEIIEYKKQSKNYNVLDNIQTKFKNFNKGILKTFTKTFKTIGTSIKSIGYKTLGFIGKTISFTSGLISRILVTSISILNGVIANVYSIAETFTKGIFSFLLSKPGLMVLAFICGYIWGRFSGSIKEYINSFSETVKDIVNNIKNIFSVDNIKDSITNNETFKEILDNVKPLVETFEITYNFIRENQETILSLITTIATGASVILSITEILSVGKMLYPVANLMTKGLTRGVKGLGGGISGGLAILSAVSAMQTIYSEKAETRKYARQLLDIDYSTINAITATNKLYNLSRTPEIIDIKNNQHKDTIHDKPAKYDTELEQSEYNNISQSLNYLKENFSDTYNKLNLQTLTDGINLNPSTDEERENNKKLFESFLSNRHSFNSEQRFNTDALTKHMYNILAHYDTVKPESTTPSTTGKTVSTVDTKTGLSNTSGSKTTTSNSTDLKPTTTPIHLPTVPTQSKATNSSSSVSSLQRVNIPTALTPTTSETLEQTDTNNSTQPNSSNLESSINAQTTGSSPNTSDTSTYLPTTSTETNNTNGLISLDLNEIKTNLNTTSLSTDVKDDYIAKLITLINTQNDETIKTAIMLLLAEHYKQFEDHYNKSMSNKNVNSNTNETTIQPQIHITETIVPAATNEI